MLVTGSAKIKVRGGQCLVQCQIKNKKTHLIWGNGLLGMDYHDDNYLK